MNNKIIRYIISAVLCLLAVILAVAEKNKLTDTSSEVVYYEKMVAITFDDGPSTKYTKVLLDGLKERGVKATFFLVGENVVNNKELVKRMDEEGHMIGNHTYSHVELCKMNDEKIIEEISKTNEIISEITGKEIKYLRPPFGSYNEKVLWDMSLTPVLWSCDTKDWSLLNTDRIVDSTMKNVKNGDIILMHDIYPTSVEAALRIIDELTQHGYTFVTVDALIIE